MRIAKEWWNTVVGNDEIQVVNAVAIAGIGPHDKETEVPILQVSPVSWQSSTVSDQAEDSIIQDPKHFNATPSAPPLDYSYVDSIQVHQGETKEEIDKEVNVNKIEEDWVELDNLVLKEEIAEDQRILKKQRAEEINRKFSSSQVKQCLETYNKRQLGKYKKDSSAMQLLSQLIASENSSSCNHDCYVDLLLTLTQSDDIKLSDLAENRGFIMLLMRQEEKFIELYNDQYHSGTKAALASFYRVVERSLQDRTEQEHARQAEANKQYEQGVEHRDVATAFACFTEAAQQGHTKAQLHLGLCYDNGIGIAKNPAHGYHWYNIAANQGNSTAMYHQAVCLAVGRGIGADLKKASEVLENAANSGFALAHCTLGFCFEQMGEKAKSDKHYQQAENEYVDIDFQKGKLFEEGIFCEVNLEQAIASYRQAQAGNQAAQSALTLLQASNPELFSTLDRRDDETKSADSNDAENVIRREDSSLEGNGNRYRLFCPRSLQRIFCSRSCNRLRTASEETDDERYESVAEINV